MRDLDFNLLRVLVALYRSRSVSKAAAELELSQPATSLALGRLRKALNDPLFVRSRSGMLPTTRCTELAEAAAKAIADFNWHVMNQSVFDPTTSRREFVVTMFDVGELLFLPQLMAFLEREAPHCNLRCDVFAADDVEPALEDGRCDLAFGPFSYLDRLHVQPLSMLTLVCLVRDGHPKVRSEKLSMQRFLELPHVVVRPTGLSQEMFEALLKEAGCTRRVQLVTTHFLAVPAIIAATDMIVTVPRPIADYYTRLENLRKVEPPLNIEASSIGMFWHPRLHKDPASVWLRESVVRLFGSMAL